MGTTVCENFVDQVLIMRGRTAGRKLARVIRLVPANTRARLRCAGDFGFCRELPVQQGFWVNHIALGQMQTDFWPSVIS